MINIKFYKNNAAKTYSWQNSIIKNWHVVTFAFMVRVVFHLNCMPTMTAQCEPQLSDSSVQQLLSNLQLYSAVIYTLLIYIYIYTVCLKSICVCYCLLGFPLWSFWLLILAQFYIVAFFIWCLLLAIKYGFCFKHESCPNTL